MPSISSTSAPLAFAWRTDVMATGSSPMARWPFTIARLREA
jgi:hypothetical protein